MLYVLMLFLSACMFRPTSLEDVTESVQTKGKGVIIEIEPGNKK